MFKNLFNKDDERHKKTQQALDSGLLQTQVDMLTGRLAGLNTTQKKALTNLFDLVGKNSYSGVAHVGEVVLHFNNGKLIDSSLNI